MKFRVGDRVERREDVCDPKSRLRTGTIIERYSERTQWGYYPELYAVEWDDKPGIERAFLPHGLEPFTKSRQYDSP